MLKNKGKRQLTCLSPVLIGNGSGMSPLHLTKDAVFIKVSLVSFPTFLGASRKFCVTSVSDEIEDFLKLNNYNKKFFISNFK